MKLVASFYFPCLYLLLAGFLTATAVFTQIGLSVEMMVAQGRSVLDALDRVLCFFTILTNLGLVLYYSAHFAPPSTLWHRLWVRPSVEGGLALSIFFVGLIFAVMLQFLVHHTGLPLLCDRLLHFVTPALYLFYWACLAPKGNLAWSSAGWWLLYPLLYFGYLLGRGLSHGQYPYPFVNVAKLGYPHVLGNAAVLLLLFWLVGLVLVVWDRHGKKS